MAELTILKVSLAKMAQDQASAKNDRGGEFLSAKMPPTTKHIMDRVTSEWVIDENLAPVKSEAELYLEMPAPPMHQDVLKWWASNETKFSALSNMASHYLGVPATSASAERLFSIAGRTYDDLRESLKDDMLETTMGARINREKRHGNHSV